MKVKIMQRSVYHKYAEIEVEVPKDVDAQEWLMNNEEKWVDVIDTKINISEFVFGNGMDTYDWTDRDGESEWMYMGDDGFGGHL
tara:strand:- start:1360 stop:1611 length:252 start_codon:yes stop_codon:yes gene_type:complete